jgi:hypothetical protein
METDQFFRRAAEAVRDLINKRPWSPTVDEIASNRRGGLVAVPADL